MIYDYCQLLGHLHSNVCQAPTFNKNKAEINFHHSSKNTLYFFLISFNDVNNHLVFHNWGLIFLIFCLDFSITVPHLFKKHQILQILLGKSLCFTRFSLNPLPLIKFRYSSFPITSLRWVLYLWSLPILVFPASTCPQKYLRKVLWWLYYPSALKICYPVVHKILSSFLQGKKDPFISQ